MATKKKVSVKQRSQEIEINKDIDKVESIVSRKEFLRENLIEHLEEIVPETDRKFDMYKVCELRHTRGSFRNFMDGDFKPEDKKLFLEILQDLKKEGYLLHVGGRGWARLEV